MSNESQVAVAQPKPRASNILATLVGMEPQAMLDTIKAQCFKGNPANISDTQLAAFVSIAAEMGVNPLLPGMIYAYPSSGGAIVPMMGPDAVFKKLTEHKDVAGWETTVYPEDVTQPPTHAVTKIYRKSSDKPLTYTAVLSEWKIGANPNWNSRPRHMLSLRSLKQCARQIIHGIPFDEDERVMMEAIDVTPEAPKVDRPAPPPRKAKGAAAVREAATVDAVVEPVTTATPAPITPTDVQAQVPVAPAPEPVASPAAPAPVAADSTAVPAPKEPRAFLKPDETLTADVLVEALETRKVDLPDRAGVPTVKARVSGEYVGDVYHFDGADSDLAPKKIWVVGAKLRVTLKGRNGKAGVRAIVETVAEVEDFG